MKLTKVTIIRSPNSSKKFRAIFEDGFYLDFGDAKYPDYTLHKKSDRMRNYIIRHGGKISKKIKSLKDSENIRKVMLNVKESEKETWNKKFGLKTAGFWSRWLLWSSPNMQDAKKLMEREFNLKITLKNN